MSRRNSPDRGRQQRSKEQRYKAPSGFDYSSTDSLLTPATGDLVPVTTSAPANLDPSTNPEQANFLTEVKEEVEGYKDRLRFVYDAWQRAKGTSDEPAKESDFHKGQTFFRNYLQGKSAEMAGDLEAAYNAILTNPADAKAAADALQAAEDAFYAKLELHDQGDKDVVNNFQDALENKGEIAPERLEAILETALGSRVTTTLSDHIKERIRTEKKLIDIVTDMMNEKRGEKIDTNDAFVNALVQTFQAAHDKDMARAAQSQSGNSTSNHDAPVGRANATGKAMAFWANRQAGKEEKRNERVSKMRAEGLSEEEIEKRLKRSDRLRALGKFALAGVVIVGGSLAIKYGIGHFHHGGGMSPTDRSGAGGHGAEQQPNGSGTGGLTPEQFTAQSYRNEIDFLNTNHRVGNDFNNITANEIGVPGDKNHFAGYTALHDQYTKSPVELTAQVQQIQSIEQSNGHSFTVLNEFPRQPGESDGSYYARLGDAMHTNQELHDHVTTATLDYVQQHGQSLQDLTQDYGSNYVVLENGKPVVKWDDYVHSTDPNDKVLLLSSTKGIRFPCGQPIELIPVRTVSTPVVPVEHVAHVTPQVVQENVQETAAVQEYYETPLPPPQPPQWTPPVPQPPHHWQPPHNTPKSTPIPFERQPNHPMGSGDREGNTPKPVIHTQQPPKIPAIKQPFSQGAPRGNAGGGHNSASGHAH